MFYFKIAESGEPFLKKLVLFITGQPTLYPETNIHVEFLNNPSKKLMEADSCFNKVYIPVTHPTYEDFKKSLTTSVYYGGVGYGRF